MKVLFRLPAFCFVLFSMFNIACSPMNINSFENNPKGILSPTPKNSTPEGNNRIIKETGWHVPSTKNTTTGEQTIRKIKSVDGKLIKVKTTYFTPNDKIIYKEEPPYATMTRVQGQLELIHFQEFNLKGNIYLYEITTQKYLDKSQTNDNATHEEMFVYQILDDDGDGKFETLIDKRLEVLVPKWAIE